MISSISQPEADRQLSSPVGTFLFSLSSFMPAASAMVSASAAKSFSRYSFGILLQRGGAEMALQHFAGRRRHRHRHVHFAGKLEAEIEVLAQQFRREGRGPVEIDQRRRFVAR